MDSTTFVIAALALLVGLAFGVLLGQRQAVVARGSLREELRSLSTQAAADTSRHVLAMSQSHLTAAEQVVTPVRDSLDRLNQRIHSMEVSGASWEAQLKQQVESVHLSGEELRRETRSLADALRRPQIRGAWGELQLKRSLELSGLTEHCTFDAQVSRLTDDGVLRPDVVVSMAGGKSIVIDAKVSLDAFLEATHAMDAAMTEAALDRHAKQVRRHADALAAKTYWQQFAPTPEFVIMFLPAEAIFSQAVETDPALIEHAAAKGVMLATPTTLIAMLKTVAYAWSQEALADNARDVHRLGRELYERIATMGGLLDSLGRSINSTVSNYNRTVGSLESRVLVSARRMRDLKVTDTELSNTQPVSELAKPLTAPELVTPDEAPAPVIDGRAGREQWTRRAAGD